MFGVGSGTISRYVQLHGLKWPIKYRRCVSSFNTHVMYMGRLHATLPLVYEPQLAMADDDYSPASSNCTYNADLLCNTAQSCLCAPA